jgi:uncharacterized alkaline shock family protein YloU
MAGPGSRTPVSKHETPAEPGAGSRTGPKPQPDRPANDNTNPPPARRQPDPEKRGRTTIAARVVEKIAAHAVDEIEPAGGVARRLLGMPIGTEDGRGEAQATARIDGDIAILAVRMSIEYPAPIRRTADAARDRVVARVGELTRLQVKHVDIDIAKLTPPTTHPRVQ